MVHDGGQGLGLFAQRGRLPHHLQGLLIVGVNHGGADLVHRGGPGDEDFSVAGADDGEELAAAGAGALGQDLAGAFIQLEKGALGGGQDENGVVRHNGGSHVGEPAGAVFSGPFFLDIRGGEGRFGVRHAGRAGLAAELGEVERGVRRDGGGGTGSGRPRGRRWETGGAGRDGQCQQRAEQALFQLHGATSFLRRSGRPAGLAANKKESRFRLSIPRSGDALPCVWARFPAEIPRVPASGRSPGSNSTYSLSVFPEGIQ